MDSSTLLQSVAAAGEYRLSLLFEGGAQTPEAFAVFKELHSSEMYSLYRHPQLTEAQNYGPWLLNVKHKDQLGEYIVKTPGTLGVIVSTRSPDALAIQLASGCSIITPDGTTALVRFYAHHVISVLAQQNEQDWHTLLFHGITQWWVPEEDGWQSIDIAQSTAENPRDHAVRLNDEIWQKIADKLEVRSVLTQWQKMPVSQHFSPCVQRDMVIKALGKAKAAGIATPLDQKIYALYYLNGGKKVLESEEMQGKLLEVSQGKTSLAEVLLREE
ncbi:DUF4123 domain-containing protein [Erwinia sp. Eh17-17]|uniref:DUF4123 domain-containing protein n=1 Tax=Erwinia sp. Eh17-17 TaxID=3080330 RepID=UPI00320B88EF